MKLELLDSLSIPSDPAKANEDAFGVRERGCVVLDGATGLGAQLLPGPSDAAWLARFGANRILSYVADGAIAHEAVTAALFDADTSFRRLCRRPPAERYEMPYASLMLTVARSASLEFLWYGDCAALLRRPGESVEMVGEALATRAREAERAKILARSKGEAAAAPNVRETFLPALRAARNLVNTTGGGYLFGPDVTAADHAQIRQIDIPAGTHLMLMTDGFLALASDYGRYDCADLLEAAIGNGLPALARELREVEEKDPEGRKYPRFKKSDDATAVLLQVAD